MFTQIPQKYECAGDVVDFRTWLGISIRDRNNEYYGFRWSNLFELKKAKNSGRLAAHVNSGFEEHFHGDTPFDLGSENEVSYGQNGGVDQKANAVSTVKYPLFNASDFKGIPHSHVVFLANACAITDPTSFHQAKIDDGQIEAINKELTSLEENKTWTLTSLPSGHTPSTSKWVFKTKFKADRSE
ncbi:hypothetical protein Tco_1515606 [Tanacetum coccineum]